MRFDPTPCRKGGACPPEAGVGAREPDKQGSQGEGERGSLGAGEYGGARESDEQGSQGDREQGGKASKGERMSRIQSHEELDVYRLTFEAAMRIFELTKGFPKEETYSLTDQMRRSSRSVCSNIAEAWRKRRYTAVFVNKLNDAEAEAAETQTWIQFATECDYLKAEVAAELCQTYENVIGKLVRMIINPDPWILR